MKYISRILYISAILGIVPLFAQDRSLRETVPMGSEEQVTEFLETLSASLSANESRILANGLKWYEEWLTRVSKDKPMRSQWIIGKSIGYIVIVGHARHLKVVQDFIDDLYQRRLDAMAKANDQSLSPEDRTRFTKEADELKKKKEIFIVEREQTSEDWRTLVRPKGTPTLPDSAMTLP